ncbi:MAG: NACHT domain-containing protein, partial [Planctomycetota bacterium]|nr:NACHT domain-containing protein [Planctomycetota bacterium]
MSEPLCPRCAGGGTVLWNERTRDALCRACGESFTLGDDDLSATTSATVERDLASFRDDPRVAALPVFLAAPLARVLAAPHPRVALHELADAAEMVVRWVTAVALAEVLATEGRDSLPASLLEELEEVPIERPTLGAWLALRNTLLRQLPEARTLRSGLRPLEELWASCFAKGEDDGGDGTVATSLFVLRNRLAHGGAFHTEAAERLVPGHLERLEMLARGVSEATRGGELVGRHAGRTYSLVGPLPHAAPDLSLTQSLPASGLFLLDSSGQPLNLAPLLRFEPVVPTLGEPPLEPGDPVPQAYFRASRHAAQFTPLDGHHASSFSRDVTGLRRVFGLDRPRTASTAPIWLSECQARAADCLAREAELMHLKRWLKERDPRAALPRIAWLHGRPGSGKSTLVARVTADQANARPERQVVYHHAFLRGHWRCSRRAFLLGLEQALADWPPLEGVVDPTLETGADGERLRQSVVERLTGIVRLRSHDPRQPPPRALVVVDGLEEIAAVDPSFPGLLLELAPPGVLMLVVGQPDRALVEWARSPDVHALFDGDGLPPLSVEGVRAVLRSEGIDVTA